VEAVVIFGGEGLEVGDAFAVDDLSFGVDAGFECVLGRASLALGGAGAGGLARVGSVSSLFPLPLRFALRKKLPTVDQRRKTA
jgi:hypothetical protein